MDERIAILTSDGKFTGKTTLKSHAHRMGLFHATVHIWFYTSVGNILVQQRGRNKATYPLLWDVSVAGHIGAREAIKIAAIREVEEEIGLHITENNLKKIGVFKSVQKHRDDLVDCEFHHVFLCVLKVSLHQLKKQASEVEALKLISLLQFTEEIKLLKEHKNFVPHATEYYKSVIKSIKKSM